MEIADKVRVPPNKFGLDVQEAVKSSLEDKWEGVVEKTIGVVLSILSVEDIGEGRILPGDGAIFYPVKFKLVTYQPELHELVKGEIIDVTEFGAFVRFGPLDGMIHVSQVMNDFVSYDSKSSTFLGRDSKRKLKEGDLVAAKIISVSMERDQFKIGLTARQAGLGALEWIEEDKKKAKRKASSPKEDEEKPKRAAPKRGGAKKK